MKIENGIFTVTKDELKAAMAFASKDNCRPHLNGVCFDEGAGYVVATDGHTLVRLGTEQRGSVVLYDDPYVVPLSTCKQALGMLRKASYTLTVTSALTQLGKTVVCLAARDELGRQVGKLETEIDHDVVSPPYAAAIPGDYITGIDPVGLDAKYLARLLLVGKATGKATTGVKLTTLGSELDPVGFTATGPEMTASVVIMPMRI